MSTGLTRAFEDKKKVKNVRGKLIGKAKRRQEKTIIGGKSVERRGLL